MPFGRRLFGAALLLAMLGLGAIAPRLVARAPAASVSLTRRSYRAYLERHGARVVATDSAALQRTLSDCGVAVVREALRGVGLRDAMSRDSLARLTGLTASGTTLRALAGAIRNAGAYTIDHERAQRVLGKHLTVAHFSFGHFVLVRGSTKSHVWFFDPLVGEVEAPAALFDTLWSGGAFAVLSDTTRSIANARLRTR